MAKDTSFAGISHAADRRHAFHTGSRRAGMSAAPRLYLDAPLSAGARPELDRDQAHYLLNVMRLKDGAPVRVFNARDGEWLAQVEAQGRRAAVLTVGERLRGPAAGPDIALYFAPVKKARTDFIVEKATELGARAITPVMTRYTQAERVRPDRLAALAREAAEQTGRLDLPVIGEPVTLEALIAGWDAARRLIFCDEAGGRPMLEALLEERDGEIAASDAAGPHDHDQEGLRASHDGYFLEADSSPPPPPLAAGGRGGSWAVLTGPEGGFAPPERALLHDQPFVLPVSLGPRILRADTAAAAALGLWQAVLGDWR